MKLTEFQKAFLKQWVAKVLGLWAGIAVVVFAGTYVIPHIPGWIIGYGTLAMIVLFFSALMAFATMKRY